jgi:aryl-alcohol dehydrogenase-like predicted oxidoreductase
MDDSDRGAHPSGLAANTPGNILTLYQKTGCTVKSKPLANTGWRVSEIALGTVELGMEYGFRGSAQYSPPSFNDAVALLRRAFDLGITLFDTAPTYGSGEALLGCAFDRASDRPHIATKVIVPGDDSAAERITTSIESSLRSLRMESIDILQIHNTTVETLEREDVMNALYRAQRVGKVRWLGVSVDSDVPALRAICTEGIETIQLPFNLLNQSSRSLVFSRAAKSGRSILVRSAYLRGVLTSQLDSIPERLSELRRFALDAFAVAQCEADTLAEAALRFCLSFAPVASVIIGVKTIAELESNLRDADRGPLSPSTVQALAAFAVEDKILVNPIHWGALI